MKDNGDFNKEYAKLNREQKEAVEALDGPVMVVAGPGTGKTQIVALRIANILIKTDTKADGILCLTFTNSAVEAMKKRLEKYIGEASAQVNVSTFHSFGNKVIEEHYGVLGLKSAPRMLDEADTAILFQEILNSNDWQYLRPRSDASRYFSDLKSVVSLLKRERLSSEEFLIEVEKEIEALKGDPENISTRGESKGEIKKEVLGKIESLERSKEVAKFFDIYEEVKKEKNVIDYDDVLEYLVKIAESSKDAVADIRERYLYVLVDEHQDSSRVQNEFLKAVWGKVDKPNIMVVGDDRQLIYGFSGASISHFQGFKKTFKDASLITLVKNYRSTQVILDASHMLLQSVMTDKKLSSNTKEHHPIRIIEAESPEEEILACAEDIKEKIKGGVSINECAILVSKNAQVRQALKLLHSAGLAVSSPDALNLFDQEGAQAIFRVLNIVSNPSDRASLARSFFDEVSGVLPLEAHEFLSSQNMKELSLENLTNKNQNLFGVENKAEEWLNKLQKWRAGFENHTPLEFIKLVGEDLLLRSGEEGKVLVAGKEILNTITSLFEKQVEKNPNFTLRQFLVFIEQLDSYGEHIPVILEEKEGVKVLTLHSSKGLEFDYVWIAHVDEKSLNSGKRMSFTLPDKVAKRIEDRDVDKIKRKLYVAITRAKRFCTLSYATYSTKDSEQELAKIIQELPEEVFEKEKAKIKENNIEAVKEKGIQALLDSVKNKYKDKYVSVSLLNNFFECPWKWYFSNLLQLPSPSTEILEFGIVVHSVIDKILKLKNVPNKEEAEEIITETVLERGFRDENMRARMSKDSMAVVLPWIEKRLPQIKLSRKTEEPISIKDERFPHLKIFGKIDLIENLGPGEVRVTDFKTGSFKKRSEIEKIDDEGRLGGMLRQLSMYSYLLKNNPKWNGVEVRESRLEFLESRSKESLYDHYVTGEEIDLLVKDIKDYDNLVKSGEWATRECHYNSYGKNTECEYCKLSEVFK